MVGGIEYLNELLEVESVFVRREFETLRQSYYGVFDFLPELNSEFDRLLEFKGCEIDLAPILKEAKIILSVHSEWILKYSQLSDAMKQQQPVVDWLRATKLSALSMGFLCDSGRAFIFDNYNEAVKEAKRKISEVASSRKREEERLRQSNEDKEKMAHELELKKKRNDAEFVRLINFKNEYDNNLKKLEEKNEILENIIKKYSKKVRSNSVCAIFGTLFLIWGVGAFGHDWAWYVTLGIFLISAIFLLAAFDDAI